MFDMLALWGTCVMQPWELQGLGGQEGAGTVGPTVASEAVESLLEEEACVPGAVVGSIWEGSQQALGPVISFWNPWLPSVFTNLVALISNSFRGQRVQSPSNGLKSRCYRAALQRLCGASFLPLQLLGLLVFLACGLRLHAAPLTKMRGIGFKVQIIQDHLPISSSFITSAKSFFAM